MSPKVFQAFAHVVPSHAAPEQGAALSTYRSPAQELFAKPRIPKKIIDREISFASL
jgi:hypothetical protein